MGNDAAATTTTKDTAKDGSNHGNRLSLLRQAHIRRERGIKWEMVVVGLLWLVGCPLLASMPSTRTGSLWATESKELCGTYHYSVSASMTGAYPKVFGSIMVPLFALLMVQRTSIGLCSILKLGWMSRFSPLLDGGGGVGGTRDNSMATTTTKKTTDTTSVEVAMKLWKRIERIEYLGYFAAAFFIGLVVFDSKDFPSTHCFLADLGFMSLYFQNRLIGGLNRDFPTIFPKHWTSRRGTLAFYWGLFFLVLLLFTMYSVGTVEHFHRCDDFLPLVESVFSMVPGNNDPIQLASLSLWFMEYASGILWIYVQSLEEGDKALWDFLGDDPLPYAVILSRISLLRAVRGLFGWQRDAEFSVFLGVDPPASSPSSSSRPLQSKEGTGASSSNAKPTRTRG